jgi:hypothetical protein
VTGCQAGRFPSRGVAFTSVDATEDSSPGVPREFPGAVGITRVARMIDVYHPPRTTSPLRVI